ncbi:MAG: hypothetical protein LZ172_00520 [Thaumarchaeota archaeon]|jgi:hypothetical protein|nr:hypothetical protein [Candidatus Geocrenenecus arthurdayi]
MSIEPIHADAFFTLDISGRFTEILIFDYFDREEFYHKLIKDEEACREEMERLIDSMNYFLRQEEVYVNNERVDVEVSMINLEFRGAAELPSIIYIIEFSGKIRDGLNIYECRYEAGVAEYDYEVYWVFPSNVEIVEAKLSGEIEILNRRLLISSVRKGEKYNGHEKIVFEVARNF